MRVVLIDDDTTSAVLVAHAVMAVCGASGEWAWAATEQVARTGNAEVARFPDRDSAEHTAVRFLRYGIRAMVLP